MIPKKDDPNRLSVEDITAEDKKFAAHVYRLGEKLFARYSVRCLLNEIPHKGKVILCSMRYGTYGLGRTYQSELLTDPTWLDVAVHFNRSIKVTKDTHHKFLEGLTLYEMPDLGVSLLNFVTGS